MTGVVKKYFALFAIGLTLLKGQILKIQFG